MSPAWMVVRVRGTSVFLIRRGSGAVLAAWVALAAVILAWDLTAADEQTLSEVFRHCRDRPEVCAVVTVTWALLTAHLFGVLLWRAGPFHVASVLRR